MTWLDDHRRSEALGADAAVALRQGDELSARALYQLAAQAEQEALAQVERDKPRTRAITAVSAVSLWFKAQLYDKAEQLAYNLLGAGELPEFARFELRSLVQAIWTEDAKRQAGVTFLPGQVYVSVKGGQIVTGGAPLDLVVDKVQTIQSLFYRTIEESKHVPLRRRGLPSREIQESCRPWLFQAPPGSYQFSVAVQEPAQADFFSEGIRPESIAERFIDILRATATGDIAQLAGLVPDEEYRATYLKLARNLAPNGKQFEELAIRSAGSSAPVSLSTDSRRQISAALKATRPTPPSNIEQVSVELRGVLRAVDLNRDYIDVTGDGVNYHVTSVKDALDDVIGPMVNRPVLVHALRSSLGGELQFIDVELDE